jgi:nitroreductase
MMKTKQVTEVVDEVMQLRRSVRGFLPTPVPRQMIEDILRVSSKAPSGSNIQPWKVYVLSGSKKQQITNAVLEIFNDPEKNLLHRPEYIYYPKNWTEPFLSRRRKVGYDLYALAGIARGEHQKMHELHAKNYEFFGAPVALMLTIPRVMEQGSWLDYGMFVQNILIAATARGLASCPQAAFISYHQVITDILEIPSDEQYVMAISLGYEDTSITVNQLVTERAELDEFVKFCDEN